MCILLLITDPLSADKGGFTSSAYLLSHLNRHYAHATGHDYDDSFYLLSAPGVQETDESRYYNH